jgi:thymidylate kinase
MIIELFGPAGSGKTTLAHALAAHLREAGHTVEAILSCRPDEHHLFPLTGAKHQTIATVLSRILRPFTELMTLARNPLATSSKARTAVDLIAMMPPHTIISALKLGQYILRLCRSWDRAATADHIVLFDQAFVQALWCLAVLARAADEAQIADALSVAPRSDLLIRLDAPRELLETRLNDRLRLQNRLERLFEFDLKVNLDSTGIFDQLYNLVRKRGQSVIKISSTDGRSLHNAVGAIEERVLTTLEAKGGMATS